MEYKCISCTFLKIFYTILIGVTLQTHHHSAYATQSSLGLDTPTCSGNGENLKYLSGDALSDSPNCIGPDQLPYPSAAVARTFGNWIGGSSPLAGGSRRGRMMSQMQTIEPSITQNVLLKAYAMANENNIDNKRDKRYGRSIDNNPMAQCSGTPARLCKTRYNTTAPMYGVSLTSGQPVTIVQKFPDLLQQVVFEVCESSECDVVRGECTQTYVPYLFLVIPLGPVTLTGQDYVLVESGCVCKPKYAIGTPQEPNIIP